MLLVNEAKKLVRNTLDLASVKNWINQAKKLKRVFEYYCYL